MTHGTKIEVTVKQSFGKNIIEVTKKGTFIKIYPDLKRAQVILEGNKGYSKVKLTEVKPAA